MKFIYLFILFIYYTLLINQLKILYIIYKKIINIYIFNSLKIYMIRWYIILIKKKMDNRINNIYPFLFRNDIALTNW